MKDFMSSMGAAVFILIFALCFDMCENRAQGIKSVVCAIKQNCEDKK